MYGKIMTINYNFQSKNRQVGKFRKALALGFLFMYFFIYFILIDLLRYTIYIIVNI